MTIQRTVYILATSTTIALSPDSLRVVDSWFGTRDYPIPAAGSATEDFLFDLQLNSDLSEKAIGRLRRELGRVHHDRARRGAA
jgi:hypothetical protein